MTIVIMQGLTEQEFNGIKEAIEKEIPFKVRFHKSSQAKYALGAVGIAPIRVDGKWEWTPQQVDTVIKFCHDHKLSGYGDPDIWDGPHRHNVFKHSGLEYLRKVVATA